MSCVFITNILTYLLTYLIIINQNKTHTHRRNRGWKVGGDYMWGGCRFLLFPPSSLLTFLSLFAPTAVAPNLFLHQFPHPWNPEAFAVRPSTSEVTCQCPKMAVTKVGGDQIHLFPRFSKVRGDASHGSHRVVEPTQAAGRLYTGQLMIIFCSLSNSRSLRHLCLHCHATQGNC